MTQDATQPVEQTKQGDGQVGHTPSPLVNQALDLLKNSTLTGAGSGPETTNGWISPVELTNVSALFPRRNGEVPSSFQLAGDRAGKQELDSADIPSDQADEIFNKYGVDVMERTVNGKKQYLYQYIADGKTVTAATSDATPEGIERALKEIEQKSKAEMRRIELEFGVKIPEPGKIIGTQTDICSGQKGDEVKTRLPTLTELTGLRDGLQKSRPAQHPKDGAKVHFYFADKPLYTGPSDKNTPAMSHEVIEGNPSIVISPDARDSFPYMTEKDKDMDKNLTPDARAKIRTFSSAINHELGHTTHYNFDKNYKVPETFLKAMGIEEITNPDDPDGEKMHAVRTKDGKLYAFLPEAGPVCGNEGAGKWYQINEQGQTLDKNGQPVVLKDDLSNLAELDSLTREEMLDKAANRASSAYMDNIREVIAEALMNYRQSPETRKALQQENLQLYELAKELDQKDIDRTYPGKGFVRRENGTIGAPRPAQKK